MEKIFSYIGKLATIVTIIGGCVAIYFAFHEKQIKLDVQTSSAENLTTHKATQDLSVKYYFQDSLEVHNLWRMQWVIRNIGDQTIIGTGTESHLFNNGLPFSFTDSCQIISLQMTGNNNNAILQPSRIWFQQWRRNEYVELTAFIESVKQPEILLSNRDVIDSEISYSQYSPESTANKSYIIEYFPRWINKTLMMIYYFFWGIILIAVCAALLSRDHDIPSKFALTIVFLFMTIPLLWIIQI